MKCSYCGHEEIICNSGMYVIKWQPIKGVRRQTIGYCCDKCESEGKKTEYRCKIRPQLEVEK